MEQDALKPCPFCGGKAERCENSLTGLLSMAQCRQCGATAFDVKWNRRAVAVNEASTAPREAGIQAFYADESTTNTLQGLNAAFDVYEAALVPAGEQWRAMEAGEPRTSWYYESQGDRAGWQAIANRMPATYQIETRLLYADPTLSKAKEG